MNRLERIIEMQGELNERTMPGWKDKELDFTLAAQQEIGELIDSFDWKWWKKGINDYINAKIEIVDILHFLLSLLILENKVLDDNMEEMIEGVANSGIVPGIEKSESAVHYSIKLRNSLAKGNEAIRCIAALMRIARAIDFSYEEIVNIYMGKSVLNKFRQDNGYATGTYEKDWNGEEDNSVMMDIISHIAWSEHTEEYLYGEFEKKYKEITEW